ncbi:hypothetical protein [Methanosarcina sp. 1.H.T.1A.1]|uniref:hypothetical protein n=1 Tax=Methanosarcina sp. 1.H.T.1A.1 TaxID=1483602 RepID=UPI000AF4ED4C|nr:hypothetical protein [Methanosarcina sp. 1.H.T.1A.1]
MKEGERGEKRRGETTSFLNILETVGVLATLIFVLTSILGMGVLPDSTPEKISTEPAR